MARILCLLAALVAFTAALTPQEQRAQAVINRLLAALDRTQNGKLSLDEFQQLASNDGLTKETAVASLGMRQKRVDQLFTRYDQDQSGKLEASELENLFNAINTDGNNDIDSDEMMAYAAATRQASDTSGLENKE